MENNQPQIQLNCRSESQIELVINAKPVSRFVVIVLFILAILTFSLPVLIGVGLILSGAKIGFGIIIPTGVFILIGIFIYRSYLWNAYGREVFLFEKSSLKYHCDYKRFQDRKIHLEGGIYFSTREEGQLEVKNETMDSDDLVTLVRLQFSLGDDESLFDSHIDIPKSVIESVMNEVQHKLGYLKLVTINSEEKI